MKLAIVAAASLVMVGCGVQRVHVEELHTSFVTKGWPTGPKEEEDTLDALLVVGTWQRGRVEIETGLGYMVNSPGIQGSGPLFTSRVKVELWKR